MMFVVLTVVDIYLNPMTICAKDPHKARSLKEDCDWSLKPAASCLYRFDGLIHFWSFLTKTVAIFLFHDAAAS